jgi:acyl-coenzyme A thioesterase PaaI-like protein
VSTVRLPWSVLEDYQCFGCSPHNPAGLRLAFEPDGDGLRSRFTLGRGFESYPGVVHGGLVGVVCDETMGNLIVLRHGRSAFTVSMRQRYVAPLSTGQAYTCVARLREDAHGDERLLHVTAEVADEHGRVCATAAASYQPFTLDSVRDRLTLSATEAAALSAALSAITPVTAPNGAHA